MIGCLRARYDHDDGLILTPRLRAGTILYLGARFIVLQRLPSLVTHTLPRQRRGFWELEGVSAVSRRRSLWDSTTIPGNLASACLPCMYIPTAPTTDSSV